MKEFFFNDFTWLHIFAPWFYVFIILIYLLFFQNDLLQLFQPFGVITKLVMLRAKNQVFLSCPYGRGS